MHAEATLHGQHSDYGVMISIGCYHARDHGCLLGG